MTRVYSKGYLKGETIEIQAKPITWSLSLNNYLIYAFLTGSSIFALTSLNRRTPKIKAAYKIQSCLIESRGQTPYSTWDKHTPYILVFGTWILVIGVRDTNM